MKHYYLIPLVFLILMTTDSFAQKEKKEKKKVEAEVVSKRNLTFTKPKNAWQIGIFGGMSTLVGDVTPNLFYGNNPVLPGHNFGVFISKSWSYLFSTRLRYSTSVMFTNDAAPSTLTQNQYDITNRNNDIGFRLYSPGEVIFHNSRTQGHDLNFDFVFTLGNVNYHRERSPIVFKIFPSIGMFMYQTFYDHLDENGNIYDYASIANLNNIGVSDRSEMIKELAVMRDGVYETNAEEHVVLDEEKFLGYNARFTFGLGVGFAVRINKFLSFDFETRQTFVNDDLIDGVQWQEPNSENAYSRNKTIGDDSYNQTTLGLTYSFVNKKVGESLSMQNPLWGSDIYDKKSKDDKTEGAEELSDSTTIKLNNQVEDLERKIDNLDFLVKMMAKKQADAEEKAKLAGTNQNAEKGFEKSNLKSENAGELTAEQQKLEDESEALKTRENLNNLDDNRYKLRNGEYIYIADLKGDINAAYYLIIGSFRIKGNAKKHQKQWNEKGIMTHLMTDVKSGLYRVVVDYANEHSKALDLLDEYQENLDRTIWLIKAK